jgi:hypothetical protein
VVSTVPALFVLQRGPAGAVVRTLGAAVTFIAGLAWLAQRTVGLETPVSGAVEWVFARGGWLLVGLIVAAISRQAVRRARPRAPWTFGRRPASGS